MQPALEWTAWGWKCSREGVCILFRLYHSAEIFSKMVKRQNQLISYGIPTEHEMHWIPVTVEIKKLVVSVFVQTKYITTCLAQLISWEPFQPQFLTDPGKVAACLNYAKRGTGNIKRHGYCLRCFYWLFCSHTLLWLNSETSCTLKKPTNKKNCPIK